MWTACLDGWRAFRTVCGVSDAIEIKGLVKTFGTTRALDGLDLQVATGEVHGFLGPNGAGKSTTLRILLGLLRADSGEARLLGGDPWSDAVELHRRLAYVPGDVALWPNLTGGEVIDVLGRLRGGIDRARRDELLERFELDPTKKGRAVLEGESAEGGAGGGAGVGRGAAPARRAHRGTRPADGGGVPGGDPGAHGRRSERSCCPATSSPRSRRCATG